MFCLLCGCNTFFLCGILFVHSDIQLGFLAFSAAAANSGNGLRLLVSAFSASSSYGLSACFYFAACCCLQSVVVSRETFWGWEGIKHMTS